MGIILIGGLKHCGKSTLGRIIANDLGYGFYDMDDLILKETGNAWKSVRSLWMNLGRDAFLQAEADAARSFTEWVMPSTAGSGAVLSLGGGTVENSGAMAWLKDRGLNVYVRGAEELLFDRIMRGGRPPFLSEEDPRGDWAELYAKRDALYEAFADLIHDVDDAEPKINAQRLLVKLEKQL